MVTINDIAREAGVAKSTVSRYLNGGSVSQKTAEKINFVIQKTGYLPNTFAQSLKAKQTKMVGAITPRLDSYASNTMLSGVENYLRKKGYKLLIVNSNLEPESELEAIRSFQANRMDGIIFLMTHFSEDLEKTMKASKIPIVVVGQENPIGDSIFFSEQTAGEQLAHYLYRLGHRKIHYLAATKNDPAIGIYRLNAIRNTFLAFGDTEFEELEAGFRMDEAYEVTKRELILSQPELIVGATDMMAIGAMKACLEEGLRVPKDVSIAGFGNHATGASFYPGLTTVEYPYFNAGEIAADHLLHRINHQQQEESIELPTKLILRESVLDKR